MQYNDLANIFPMMSNDEFAALVEDIRSNGQLTPILIDQDGKILDGRNRWRACQHIGIQPKVKTVDSKENLVNLVLSLNLHRRHLSSSQKAVVALSILPLLQVEAKKRQQLAGGDKKNSNYKQPTTLPQNFEEAKKTDGEAAEIAAKLAGTNRQFLYDVKKIAAKSPNLIQNIRDGEINIRDAKWIVTLESEELQQRVIEKVKQGVDVRAARAEVIKETTPVPEFPKGKYRVIYADCPWQSEGEPLPDRVTMPSDIYPTMTVEEICNLPVKDIADNNAVLFFWATSYHLQYAFEIIAAWGFNYKSSFIWNKTGGRHLGYYSFLNHEILLLATKGVNMLPQGVKFDSVISFKKTQHSKKPGYFRDMIDQMYPTGNRIELFARRRYKNWDCFGNQIED